jgi:gas vesicle protein
MENSSNAGKIVGAVLLGTVVGGVIGAGLGMLFAPEKGSDLRKKLAPSSDYLTKNLKSKFQGLVSDVARKARSAKGTVEQLIGKATTKTPVHN